MTHAKRVYGDPDSGETFEFTRTSAETNGELLEIRAQYRPNSLRPPMHYHPYQDEHFEVTAGSLTVVVGSVQSVYFAGESFDVPAGTPHTMWNAGEQQTQVIWQTRPALNTQAFYETVWRLNDAGRFGASGTPNLLQVAVFLRAYDDEFRLVSAPRPVLRIVTALLAPIGYLLGYRAHYE